MNGHMLCSQGKGNKENNNLLFHCNGTVIALGSAKPIIHTYNLLKQHEYVLQKLYLLHNTIVQVE